MSVYRTPWTLNTDNPRMLSIVDADDKIVMAADLVCWSSRWQTAEDVENLVGVRAIDQGEWGDAIRDQKDSFKAIVASVNAKYAPVGELTTPSDVTKEELEAAIVSVLGEKRYEGLGGEDEMILCHEKACMTAFINKLEGPQIDLLRGMYEYVSKKGVYPFYQGPKP